MPPQVVGTSPTPAPLGPPQFITPPGTPKAFWKRKVVLIPAGIVLLLVLGIIFALLQSDTPAATPAINSTNQPAATTASSSPSSTQYLAFQLFTDILNSHELGNSFPPPSQSVKNTVDDIVKAIGTTGTAERKLAFVVGPLAFDHTDAQIRDRIRDSFDVAQKSNVAVAFHIDDSMFWGRMTELNTPESIEWLDFNKKLNTGRRIDWATTPIKLKPQLCVNSPKVKAAIKERATLIGEEVKKGIASLNSAGKPELFAGVIAGWETQMGKDFDTGQSIGYCALANKGFSAANSMAELDQARADITREHINHWTASLSSAGVPQAKIYSHTAVMQQISDSAADRGRTELQRINFTPASVAFGPTHYAGFSTYPGTEYMAQIRSERAKQGNPPWISAEGTSLDPALAELSGMSEAMEPYLANLYNEGATMVNVFGWGMGPKDNTFRLAAEGQDSINAYKKFLSGAVLSAVPPPGAKLNLPQKVTKIQAEISEWLKNNKSQQSKVQALMTELDGYLKASKLKEADKLADEVLELMDQ